MKSYKTLIFITCLMGGLALLAWLFPRDGIRIGNVLLEFPSLTSVLGENADEVVAEEENAEEEEVEELSPEELMALRLEALHAAKDSEFVSYMQSSSTRFYMPDDDVTYLDPFFDALLSARSKPMRIMYYGDSQLECDRITDALREHFQSEFGGNGAGLMPAVQTISTTTAHVATWPDLPRYVGFGAADSRASHRRYGPLSQMATVNGNATFSLSAIGGKSFPHCSSFRKVSILASGEGTLTLRVGESEYEMNPGDSIFEGSLHVFSKTLPSAVSKATLSAHGRMEVYGIMLDGGTGVSVDNIAMRGSSGTHFTSLDQSSMAPFFRQQNVSLIMLQYGGNSVPYLKGGKAISNYKKQIMSQIAYLQRISPRSRIIFVGPADMATTSGEGESLSLHTYQQLPQVVDSLRAAALESGAAFWDMFRVMGGRGSMVKWVNARPQLAGEDYIHFTPRGARHISNLLWETFDFYYKYYRFRKGLDPEVLPEDTIANETDSVSDTRPAASPQ